MDVAGCQQYGDAVQTVSGCIAECNDFKVGKYRTDFIQALIDGQIKPQEERFLKQLRERFGISDDEHDMLLAMLKTNSK